MSRPRPSLADYMVSALSPALIMTMVGSLVFFLIEVFYQGRYVERVCYISALFIFAAVLIARIAMAEGRAYASVFSVFLAVAVWLGMRRFTQIPFPMDVALIAIIWWCTDRLTWDCTLVDDSKDPSSQGLLQTLGFGRSAEADDGDEQPEDGTARGPSATAEQSPQQEEAADLPQRAGRWWNRMRRRPNRPGVWVVYFSLAALPLFGIGQWFIPAYDAAGRRYAFVLLCVYLASGFGLLMTTSFLGLRHYLRKRNVEMPTYMAGVWLGAGTLKIALLMAIVSMITMFIWLVPRSTVEQAIARFSAGIQSPDDVQPSRFGLGNDGPRDDELGRRPGRQADQPERSRQQPDRQAGRAQAGQSGASGQQRSGKEQSRSRKNQQQTHDQRARRRQDGSQGSGGPQQGGGQGRQKPSGSQGPQQQGGSSGQQGKAQGEQSSGQSRGGSQGSKGRQQRGGNQGQQKASGGAQGGRKQSGQSGQPQSGKSGQPQSGRNGQRPDSGEQKTTGNQRGQQGSRSGQQPSGKPPGSRQGQDGRQSQRERQQSRPEPSRQGIESGDQRRQQQAEQRDGEQQGEQQRSSGQRSSQAGSQTAPPPSAPPPSPPSETSPSQWLAKLAALAAGALRWLLYLVLLVITVLFVWFFRKELAAAWKQLVEQLQGLWQLLVGGKAAAEPEEPETEPEEPAPPPRPFADFPDPFASGLAARCTPDQLVQYSFEAFEAFAREIGCPRRPEQTPHELAVQVGLRMRSLAPGARRLADLYCQAAYAPGSLQPDAVRPLEEFWQTLRMAGAVG